MCLQHCHGEGTLAVANNINELENKSSLNDYEERFERCIRPRRRPIRLEDGQRIATYFINGGPTLGASHFIDLDKVCKTTENPFSSVSNLEMVTAVSQSNQRPARTVPPNHIPILGAVHHPSHTVPLIQSQEISPVVEAHPQTDEVVGAINSAYTRYIKKFQPHVPKYILGSIFHPQGPLLGVSNALLRLASHPVQTLVHVVHSLEDIPSNTRISEANSILSARSSFKDTREANSNDGIAYASDPNEAEQSKIGIKSSQYTHDYLSPLLHMFHPQPRGYMLQLVPHDYKHVTDYTIETPAPTQNLVVHKEIDTSESNTNVNTYEKSVITETNSNKNDKE